MLPHLLARSRFVKVIHFVDKGYKGWNECDSEYHCTLLQNVHEKCFVSVKMVCHFGVNSFVCFSLPSITKVILMREALLILICTPSPVERMNGVIVAISWRLITDIQGNKVMLCCLVCDYCPEIILLGNPAGLCVMAFPIDCSDSPNLFWASQLCSVKRIQSEMSGSPMICPEKNNTSTWAFALMSIEIIQARPMWVVALVWENLKCHVLHSTSFFLDNQALA